MGRTITTPQELESKGYQQITDVSTAKKLTVPKGAKFAWLQAEGNDIRFRDDSTSPTGTVGLLLKNGANPISYIGTGLEDLEFIDDSGGTGGVLNVLFFGYSGQ